MTREEASNQINDIKTELAEHFSNKDIKALDMAISALSESDNVGMSISHQSIAKVIDDYIANHRGDSDKQYTAYEIKTLLISDDSDKKGEWIDISMGKGIFKIPAVKCSVCGNTLNLNDVNCGRGDANFCPNCGADMRPEPYKENETWTQ